MTPRHRMGTRVRLNSEYSAYDGVTGTIVDSRTDPLSGGVTYCVKFDPDQEDNEGVPVETTLGPTYWIYEENLEIVQPLTVKP